VVKGHGGGGVVHGAEAGALEGAELPFGAGANGGLKPGGTRLRVGVPGVGAGACAGVPVGIPAGAGAGFPCRAGTGFPCRAGTGFPCRAGAGFPCTAGAGGMGTK
jgi:hypothetical protein